MSLTIADSLLPYVNTTIGHAGPYAKAFGTCIWVSARYKRVVIIAAQRQTFTQGNRQSGFSFVVFSTKKLVGLGQVGLSSFCSTSSHNIYGQFMCFVTSQVATFVTLAIVL